MKKVSLPIEEDGEEKGDHHDGRPDYRDSSSCNEGVDDDAGNGQRGSQLSDGNREKKKFRALQNPNERREGKDSNNSELISGNSQKMSGPREDETVLHLLRKVSLFTQHEGFKNSRGERRGFLFKKITDVAPPTLYPEEERIFRPVPDFHPSVFHRKKSNGVNLFKGEMALVRKPARITESLGGIKPTQKSEAVSDMEGPALFFQKEKEVTLGRKMVARSDHLLRSDQ